MPNTRELVKKPKLKVMVWAPSGAGKTTLIGTARRLGPVYIFDFDARIAGLAGLDIDYDTYRDDDQRVPKAFVAARNKLMELAKTKADEFPYAVVAVDGLTTLQIVAMNNAFPHVKAFMPKITRLNDGIVSVPTQADYQAAMSYIEQFISKLVTLPCHVIVTAHEDSDRDEILQRLYKSVAVAGKLSIRLPGYFNELWRMEVTTKAGADGKLQSIFRVVTRPDNIYSARTCYPEALSSREEPDFTAIYKKIETHLQKKAQPLIAAVKT